MSEVAALIGKPWERGASGPDAYDCWGLARKVQSILFNRELDDIPDPPDSPKELARFIVGHRQRDKWTLAESPSHGQIVEMVQVRNPFHIGVYLNIDRGGIIHSLENTGVRFDKLDVLKAVGWRKFNFYEWNIEGE